MSTPRTVSSAPTYVRLRTPHHFIENTHTAAIPTAQQMVGTWWVTHSTLPLWKDKRNVRITYSLLPAKSGEPPRLDDLVEYQALASDKVKTVHGIDTPHPSVTGAYSWRGTGLLKVASSQWEILGWGRTQSSYPGEEEVEWIVTFFQKTIFGTPAGLDFYSSRKGGLAERTKEEIVEELRVANDAGRREGRAELGRMMSGLFEVKTD